MYRVELILNAVFLRGKGSRREDRVEGEYVNTE